MKLNPEETLVIYDADDTFIKGNSMKILQSNPFSSFNTALSRNDNLIAELYYPDEMKDQKFTLYKIEDDDEDKDDDEEEDEVYGVMEYGEDVKNNEFLLSFKNRETRYIKNPIKFGEKIIELQEAGFNLGIASYTTFPQVIPLALYSILPADISINTIKSIPISTGQGYVEQSFCDVSNFFGMNSNSNSKINLGAGKGRLILEIIKQHYRSKKISTVLLFDDNQGILDKTSEFFENFPQYKFIGTIADEDGDFLKKIKFDEKNREYYIEESLLKKRKPGDDNDVDLIRNHQQEGNRLKKKMKI